MLKEILTTHALKALDWDINILEVQYYWNVFESLLVRVFDEVAPMTEFIIVIVNLDLLFEVAHW